MRRTREFPISISPTARLNRAANMRAMLADQCDKVADRTDRAMAVGEWLCVVGFAASVIGAAVVGFVF